MAEHELDVQVEGKPVESASKEKVRDALRKTLEEQLGHEASTKGHAPGRAAIHGMTGVSNRSAAKQ